MATVLDVFLWSVFLAIVSLGADTLGPRPALTREGRGFRSVAVDLSEAFEGERIGDFEFAEGDFVFSISGDVLKVDDAVIATELLGQTIILVALLFQVPDDRLLLRYRLHQMCDFVAQQLQLHLVAFQVSHRLARAHLQTVVLALKFFVAAQQGFDHGFLLLDAGSVPLLLLRHAARVIFFFFLDGDGYGGELRLEAF